MRGIFFRTVALAATVMTALSMMAKTQDLNGTVVNDNGEPITYANVVLLTERDSSFVQGAVTDEQGHFNIVTNKSKGILKLSCIGYETLYLDIKTANGLTIQMKEDTNSIAEVVVKGQLPKTHVKGDAMRTI